ncbi:MULTISPECIES: cytochrome P450 [unclassified Sphingobium]|uniref:cytochrome P450 n=1 Tax=unclassified Sphingobium TaxID=2611147 RepID=UPI00119B1D50|nr:MULTISPECIES: cytochrome P450 [unclassified Sphingobium]TWC97609.1 cytochrome P450 [Sphingobium sp. AEW010]TWD17802.1 cytochrome P450 [Sphingobium sp. AEW013]TWD20038.1 cytochrome P450 [Sphingobium sp. AEW001]
MVDNAGAYGGGNEPNFSTVPQPDHVADAHVVDFDYRDPMGIDEGVYAALSRLQKGPDIVWTPRNGGHWIVTRAEDIKWVQEHFETFSHEVFTIPRGSTPIIMPPLTVDPPNHARYRAVLNPAFTPGKVNELRTKIRELTIELIERLKAKGRCEFVADFARVMPVSIFLGIVDLPLERRAEFVEWAVAWIQAEDMQTRYAYLAKISDYLRTVLDERGANPGDDLLSRIARWRTNPRFAGEDEVMGMALLVFFGGLDTVASMLSFTTLHLARNPDLQRRLREEPAVIDRAVEEFLRRHGLSNTGRLILHDIERKGVTMKKDEMVLVPIGLSSIDERKHPDPFAVDFDRADLFDDKKQPAHNTFGNGPHKCVGAPLARAELRIFLEEWLTRIPEFRLIVGEPVKTHAGNVNGVDALHLEWNVA